MNFIFSISPHCYFVICHLCVRRCRRPKESWVFHSAKLLSPTRTTSTRRIGKIEWKILSISSSVPVRDDVECMWGRFRHDDWWLPFQVIIFNGPIGFRSEIFHLSCRRIISSFTRSSRAAVGQSTFNIENIICRTRLAPWRIERERDIFLENSSRAILLYKLDPKWIRFIRVCSLPSLSFEVIYRYFLDFSQWKLRRRVGESRFSCSRSVVVHVFYDYWN